MTNDRSHIWKTIWDKKGRQATGELHHVDGFDLLSKDQWDDMIHKVTRPLDIKQGHSILECGCGAGAFLLSLLKHYPGIKVAGMDYSESLLALAKQKINNDFYYGDMTNLSFIQSESYDRVISFSTFHYLSSEEAAKSAVKEMVRVLKPGGAVLIGDVSDLARKEKALAIRKISHQSHQKVSSESPDHLFVDKEMFKGLACDLGLEIKIMDQEDFHLPFYENAKYRYSVYLRKR